MPMSPNTVIQRVLLFAVAALAVSSCAGPGNTKVESDYPEAYICLRDFASNVHFELVNATYAKTHSASAGADMRVQSGEVMDAWILAIGDEGLWDYARPGQGPLTLQSEAGYPMHSVLEVKRGSDHGWIAFRKGLTQAELKFVAENKMAFITIFNQTPGYQQVDNTQGADIFRSN
ncbi:MAG: hypothetical protein OSB10_01580 [Planctomycetota bacterium]|nr:hypothetical protein [Planctomycetota bacterium]